MVANSTSKAIMLAGRRILCAQLTLGILFIIGVFFSQGKLSAESACIGVIIAILPSYLGMGLASIKSRSQPTKSLRDLMKLSRRTKLIYTVLLFVLTFKLLSLHNVVVLIAFSVAMLGHFVTPLMAGQDEGKA
ncbi:ATP synthase subunit I [Vibrio nitrifigilis]|uniref:ATP synthase subunit I n=1 Tax=Vibrio nitrifigilis TaxID=2789781 RepID=A0ABS0GK34_9VIBR|nr:ATP synthase subunit I [Vibrio nitrifigilis]MBF9002793.1 ATP synthase subunit I [Vibrio nitrifigilis]